MRLVKDNKHGKGLIRPENKNDVPLFSHCAGGMIAVTGREFNKNTEQVLFAHGVVCISITDNT